MTIAIVCIALLSLLVFALGLLVSVTRARRRTAAGIPEDPSDILHRVVRAHGNTIEYAPILALLIYLTASQNPSTWVLVIAIGATVSRYLIALGILLSETLSKPHPLRFLGALGTYLFGLSLCGTLLRGI